MKSNHEHELPYQMLLEMQAYCHQHSLPDLSLLTVDDDGVPVTWDSSDLGEFTVEKFEAEKERIFAVDWTKVGPPRWINYQE